MNDSHNEWISFPGPATTTVTIDGEDHSADTRHLNQRWATIVDLPTVAVTIAGPDAMFDRATLLTDARNSVSEYK